MNNSVLHPHLAFISENINISRWLEIADMLIQITHIQIISIEMKLEIADAYKE